MSPSPADPPKPRPRPRRASPAPPAAPSAATSPTCRCSHDITQLADEVEATLGPVDILVNNAGINVRGPSDQLAEGRLGRGHRHQPEGAVSLRAPVRPTHGGARLGSRDQPRVDPQRDRTARARAVRGLESRHRQPHARAGARVGASSGVTVNAICPGPVRHRDEQAAARRPGEVQGVRRKDPDGPLGRPARDRRRHGVSRLGRRRRLSPAARCSSTAAGRHNDRQGVPHARASRPRRRVRTAPQSDLA